MRAARCSPSRPWSTSTPSTSRCRRIGPRPQAQPDRPGPTSTTSPSTTRGSPPCPRARPRSSPPRSRSGSSTTSSSPTACRRAASPSATRARTTAASHYKAVHYDHGNGVAVADVDGDGLPDLYFVTQLGENQLWKNLGNGKFRNITAEAGVGLKDQISVAASFADVDNDGHPDLFVTTVRKGNHLFLNDGKGHFKDVSKEAGARLRRPLLGRRLLRLRQRRPARPLRHQRRPLHHQRGGPGRLLRRPHGRLPRPPASGPDREQHPLQEPGQPPVQGRLEGDRTCRTAAGAATPRSPTSTTTAGPTSTSSTCRGTTTTTRTSRARVRRQDRAVLPQDLLGRDGDQVLRLRQRRPARPHDHRHALGHEPGRRRSSEEKQKSDMQWSDADLQGGPTTSSATPSTTTWAAASSRRSRTRMNVEDYWPWGAEHRRPQRRRLAGPLHHRQHELPLPLRHQLPAAERPRQESSATASSSSASSRGAGGRTHDMVSTLDCDGEDQRTTRPARGSTGKVTVMSAAGHALVGDLRPRRRRRPRHRDQRLQLRAAWS